MKIYVASSWRNNDQQNVVQLLRSMGHEVYDFRNDGKSFNWYDIGDWPKWSLKDFIENLSNPTVFKCFESDVKALEECDMIVMVLPCNKSAHMELGYAIGKGKKSVVFFTHPHDEVEVMYLLADKIVTDVDELIEAVGLEK